MSGANESLDLHGYVARCSMGKLGLITSYGLVDVTYPDGNKGKAHTGIQLTDATEEDHLEYAATFGDEHQDPKHPANFVGGPWSSRSPEVVGELLPLLGLLGQDPTPH